jgi:hypothetical protein
MGKPGNHGEDVTLLRDLQLMTRNMESYVGMIEAKRREESDIDLDEVEQYLLGMSPVEALEQRLDCRIFLLEFPTAFSLNESNGAELQEALRCVRESTFILKLMSFALSIGNYLNGADERLGRADGFHIDAFGEGGSLTLTRSPEGDLKQFVIKHFFSAISRRGSRIDR